MGIQLKLPALWARLSNRNEPRDRLLQLQADCRDAKAEIREVLDRLAERHGVSKKDVTYAMDYADDMLSDVVYSVERELEHEIEDEDPV